jgi:hypothetical protein
MPERCSIRSSKVASRSPTWLRAQRPYRWLHSLSGTAVAMALMRGTTPWEEGGITLCKRLSRQDVPDEYYPADAPSGQEGLSTARLREVGER